MKSSFGRNILLWYVKWTFTFLFSQRSSIRRNLYKNDEKVGEETIMKMKVLVKCYYKNDQLNGQYIRYYPDGRREFFGRYKNDLKEGVWIYYLPDGGIDYELEYLNGKLLTELKFEDE